MKTALIKNGKVDNIIESSEEHNLSLKSKYDAVIDVSDLQADIGWGYDGFKIIVPPPLPPPIKTQKQLKREQATARLKTLDLSLIDPIIADLIEISVR